MSGQVNLNTVQLGTSATATQNFVLAVPTVQDGTAKLSRGNAGSTTQDILTVDSSGNLTAPQNVTVTGTLAAANIESAIKPITATVASNALTVGLNPTTVTFKNTTVGGLPVSIAITSALSLTVPSTATLGTTSGQSARLAILAINNAGSVVLGITNLTGGTNIDETGLISTTAISTGATSASVIYSASALTNVAYRVIGFIDISEATAGTWATAPTNVFGVGGLTMSAMSSIGYGQTYQDVHASRAFGTTYYNTTGKPIFINVAGSWSAGGGNITITINGITNSDAAYGAFNVTQGTASALIPIGASYSIGMAGGTASILAWYELR